MATRKSPSDTRFSVIPGEDPADLAELTRRFYQDCQPQTDIESLLVDDIIHDAWLLRRFFHIDAQMLNAEMLDAGISAGQAFLNTSKSQSCLQSRINDTSRNQALAIKELQRIQAQRARKPQPQSQQPIETKPVTSKNGFVPQKPVSRIQ